MTALAGLALLVWLYLILLHGQFWQSGPSLGAARPSADGVGGGAAGRDRGAGARRGRRDRCDAALAAGAGLPGRFRVILVDDASTDGTGALARGLHDARLRVLDGTPPPSGWSGKLWAVAQGIGEAGDAELLLLTDADIVHDKLHLSALVARAERDGLDLVSEMVALACDSLAERALVPAFVYFFQLLYPFAWVNDPLRATAAAAGGTMLIRRRALDRIGGIAVVRGALIDDVALARAVKRGGRIWLGHADLARSVRPYPGFAAIWRMVARTAYVQLRCSPVLLVATTLGMALTFAAPPAAALFGHGVARGLGVSGVGRDGVVLFADAGPLRPVAGVGGRSPRCRTILPGGNGRVRAGPLSRAGSPVEAAGLSGGGWVMNEVSADAPTPQVPAVKAAENVETWSGKDRGDENFPVGSLLISRALRPHVHAFYAFARNADDIADSATLPADDKLARLDVMEAVLLGRRETRIAQRAAAAREPGRDRRRRAPRHRPADRVPPRRHEAAHRELGRAV